MKNIFLIFTLLLFAISGFCQSKPVPVKIDSLVTVSLPPGYQKKDTVGEQIFTANSMYGYMVVIREPNAKNNTPLNKEKDLNKVLKTYVKGIQGESAGSSAQNIRDTTIGALTAKVFTLKSDDGSGDVQFRNFVLLYTQDATYTFEYVYPENRKDLIKDELKVYSSSIKLSRDLKRNDQYLSNAKGLSSNAKIAIFVSGGLIVTLVIVLIVMRKRRQALV